MLNKNDLRLSSIRDFFNTKNQSLSYLMKVPYDDTYAISFKKLSKVAIFDENNNLLIEETNSFKITLKKNQLITMIAYKGTSKNVIIDITALHNKAILPYEPYNQVNTRKLKTHGDNSVDPLKPAVIKAIKRNDGNGLYINCNNPEKLTEKDMGKALSRVDISNLKVFFTFEHNNFDKPFYYGYQVKNTGNEDLYVTVLNMGFQLDGQGCWLGEKEWVDFYNANFRYDGSSWNEKQQKLFKDFFNFSNTYKTKKMQPTTYRIPAGKYIYIMGGTTKDAYKHINVWKTADKSVCGGCSNAVVLFDVIGQAEGSFFVYTDPKQIENNNTHQGYLVERDGHKFGSQYVGYDNCHGVVDTNITYVFNDLTPSLDLPVTYENYYDEKATQYEKIPYKKLNSTAHIQNNNFWVTHINPQGCHDGVGTDMTKYNTIKADTKEKVCLDENILDGHGNLTNIGNWMMDYMDYFTLVNQGDKEREFTINLTNTGSVCVLLRDKHGKLIKSSPMFTIMCKQTDDKEAILANDFTYIVKIKPHSIKQFIMEYNLLANSCGYVVHKAKLK